jgi:Pyruvate/2-oxoacid:ferredoxin oxidoreductase delta subunit
MYFANIRESAGWSTEAAKTGPKMVALMAAAAVPMPGLLHANRERVSLSYGRDERAIEASSLLREHLDITALIARPDDLTPPRTTDFPIVKGRIRAAKGSLGAFEIILDDYALPRPSSRGALTFEPARDGALSRCDILLDLSGGPPLFPAADLREGYVRADPRDRARCSPPYGAASSGSFDKPRYITFTADLCAHSRSQIVGCRRCLDLCPTSAIAPAGDHVAIDEKICAGCGQCAAVCPTGAASYALPPADALMRKLRTLLMVYRDAGGVSPILLIHDEDHGGALIDALARHGEGLPANTLPLAVNEVTQIGLEVIAAAFAYGAAAVRVILRAKPRHDLAGLYNTIALAERDLPALGLRANVSRPSRPMIRLRSEKRCERSNRANR